MRRFSWMNPFQKAHASIMAHRHMCFEIFVRTFIEVSRTSTEFSVRLLDRGLHGAVAVIQGSSGDAFDVVDDQIMHSGLLVDDDILAHPIGPASVDVVNVGVVYPEPSRFGAI